MNPKTFSTPALLSCVLWLLCSFDRNNNSKEDIENKSYDVIIIPGVPYNHPSYKLVMKSRLLWANYLYKKGIAKNIIFSGSSVYTPYVEADIMRMYATALGIPVDHTFAETQAEHSTENVYYSVQMAKQLGFKNIAVATDPYQAIIIKKFIKENYPEVEVAKINYEKINLFKTSLPMIDPSAAYVDCFVSLVDRENRIKRFKGTLGKNIKPENNLVCTDLIAKLNVFSSQIQNDSVCVESDCESIAIR